jgi:hypothetical protein
MSLRDGDNRTGPGTEVEHRVRNEDPGTENPEIGGKIHEK